MQFFLGDPQGYKGPEVRYDGRRRGAAAAAGAAGIDLYVHAPYLVNVATTNNRIRIPSRKLLQQHMDAAAEIGAKGLIVHGGHVAQGRRPGQGLRQLAQGVRGDRHQAARCSSRTPRAATTRWPATLERIARLWEAISSPSGFDRVGFCLDTCHAHAGGKDLVGVVDTGQGDHRPGRPGALPTTAATSSAPAPTGTPTSADGHIDPDALVAVVRAAGAPVVCETPGGPDEPGLTSRSCASAV